MLQGVWPPPGCWTWVEPTHSMICTEILRVAFKCRCLLRRVNMGGWGGWCLIPFGTVVNLDLKNFASHVSISTKWSDSHISVVSFTPRCFKSAVVSKEFGSECGGTRGEQLSILSSSRKQENRSGGSGRDGFTVGKCFLAPVFQRQPVLGCLSSSFFLVLADHFSSTSRICGKGENLHRLRVTLGDSLHLPFLFALGVSWAMLLLQPFARGEGSKMSSIPVLNSGRQQVGAPLPASQCHRSGGSRGPQLPWRDQVCTTCVAAKPSSVLSECASWIRLFESNEPAVQPTAG